MTILDFDRIPLTYSSLNRLLENHTPFYHEMYINLVSSLWRPVSDHTYPIADHFSDRIKYIIR